MFDFKLIYSYVFIFSYFSVFLGFLTFSEKSLDVLCIDNNQKGDNAYESKNNKSVAKY